MGILYAVATRKGSFMLGMEEVSAHTAGEVTFFSLIENKQFPYAVYMMHESDPTIWIETQLHYKTDLIELVTLRAHNYSQWEKCKAAIDKAIEPIRLFYQG